MSECKNTEGPRVFLPDLERALRGPIEGVFSDIDEEDGCAIALRDGLCGSTNPCSPPSAGRTRR